MRKRPRNRGFTLIEVVAALALLGIMTAVVGMGMITILHIHDFNRANAHMAQQAGIAMARMVRELQELVDIIAINDTSQAPFIIYTRVVDPGIDDPPARRAFGLHYHPPDATLRLYTHLDTLGPGAPSVLDQSSITHGDPLIDHVHSFSLTFYQGQLPWTMADSPGAVSAIRITLELKRRNDDGKTEIFETVIFPRNIGGGTEAPS